MDAARAGAAAAPRRPGGRARAPGAAGSRVIANLCGHGVGGYLHEPPSVPSVEDPRDAPCCGRGWCWRSSRSCRPARTMAIEDADGWTLRTPDGSLGRPVRAHDRGHQRQAPGADGVGAGSGLTNPGEPQERKRMTGPVDSDSSNGGSVETDAKREVVATRLRSLAAPTAAQITDLFAPEMVWRIEGHWADVPRVRERPAVRRRGSSCRSAPGSRPASPSARSGSGGHGRRRHGGGRVGRPGRRQ